jgi:type I restriction enzyme, S subunit
MLKKKIGTLKPYLANRDVQWRCIETDNIKFIALTPSDMQRFRLKVGDLLVCEGGEIGRAAIWNDQIEECYYQKTLHRLRPIYGYNVYLMLCFFQYWVDTGFLSNFVTQTSIAHLTKEKLKDVSLPVPSEDEQKTIAQALSETDALIGSLEQLIAKKRHIKQGAMRELLCPKEGWVEKTLGDLANISRGASPRPIDSPIWFDENSEIGWVRISDVPKSGMFLYETSQRLSQLGVQSSRFVNRKNLIMSICATVGRPIITMIDLCIHDGFVVFENLKTDSKFMFCVLKSIEEDWSKNGQTGSQMNLNTNLIDSTKITIPPQKEEQERIATILSDMDTAIAVLEEKLTKTRQLKQGMMHELLTGRIRLVG